MKEAGLQADMENGKSFAENAVSKPQGIIQKLPPGDMIVLADDSGLEIDALNGEPGIYSARYMGEDTSYRYQKSSLVERWRACRWKKELHDSSVPLLQPSRMDNL